MRCVVLGGAMGSAGGRFKGRRGPSGNLRRQINVLKEVASPPHIDAV